jgi:hypothetical protein
MRHMQQCPFQKPDQIKAPLHREAAQRILQGTACPAKGFCDFCECLNCEYFPEHLRESLLIIETRMLQAKRNQPDNF